MLKVSISLLTTNQYFYGGIRKLQGTPKSDFCLKEENSVAHEKREEQKLHMQLFYEEDSKQLTSVGLAAVHKHTHTHTHTRTQIHTHTHTHTLSPSAPTEVSDCSNSWLHDETSLERSDRTRTHTHTHTH